MPVLTGSQRHPVSFSLNGETVSGYAEPRMLLSDFLRDEIGATGTHVGCEHGVCGACTIRIDGKAVRACLTLAVQAEGRRIQTVEGLSGPEGELSLLQQAFHRRFALQCGFCTPGMLMSLSELLEHRPLPSESDIRDALSGNMCRCTDYSEIVAAAMDTAKALSTTPEGE
jgi:2-furoyl-CoA dehydrogenase 2Fe-2S iron sulfur subunit